ncbi:MAG: hypothetical protein PHF86_03380 [Candidatus Nanoarchaeia archaeon]|jgi:hypothetical protein|nr:hypothetical protein [Candidatus Nanoarchaeia archaeon]
MKDQCPNCGKSNCIPEVARINTEIYGSQKVKVSCTHCGAPLQIILKRTVTLENIAIGDFNHDDWGSKCKPVVYHNDPNDSDTVSDLGHHKRKLSKAMMTKNNVEMSQLTKHHIVYESHKGYVLVYCTKTKHLFKHVINVPSKNELFCRGCGDSF